MITLTTPYIVTIGGSQVEDDTNAACMSFGIDYSSKIMTVVFKIGTMGGNPSNLVPGFYAQANGSGTITITVYCGPTQNGQTQYQWWLNGNLQSTIIPSATMASFVTQLLGDRNAAESFMAVVNGLLPGVTTAWASV